MYTTGVTELFVDTWSFTFTVIVLTFPSVFPLTVAVPVPTNLTSFAFLTCAEYSPVPSVVLSLETTHPIFLKSPTVAAVLSETFGSEPLVGFDKSTKPFLGSLVVAGLVGSAL